MRARLRLVVLLPWLASGAALVLLASAAVVHVQSRSDLRATTAETVLFVAGCLTNASAPLVGGLLARRKPSNPSGWLLLAIGLDIGLFALLPALRQAGLLRYEIGGWLEFAVYLLLFPLVSLLLLFFPDGRLPGRGWGWLFLSSGVLALGLMVVAPLVTWEHDPLAASPWALRATPDNPATSTPWAVRGAAGERLSTLFDAGMLALFLLTIAAVGSIFVRFRRAGPVPRQQLKWFLSSGALLALTVAPDLMDLRVGNSVWPAVAAVGFGLQPLAVGVAVLRYRLYEIDRIVSRTVSYGLLTAGLIGLYLLVVALLRPLLEPLTGSSALAVAGSTLAVAAVFDPARRRLQEWVDRRFDRARYDAAQAVDAFAVRLRDQVDLEEITAGLRDTVRTTVAPTRVAVWLPDPRAPRRG